MSLHGGCRIPRSCLREFPHFFEACLKAGQHCLICQLGPGRLWQIGASTLRRSPAASENEGPTFASAANKIGNDRLEPILEELSHYVTYDPPKRAELRTALTTVRDKTDTFEKALNAITPYLLDLPFLEMECLIASREVVAKSEPQSKM